MKDPDMPGMTEEEIGRLANRLAMLVSDDGEADNAGRAVGALARRLGLSGGQLKAIFMAGMDQGRAQAARVGDLQTRLDALAEELDQTRQALNRTEAGYRSAQRERDALRDETDLLRDALDQRRTSRQVRWVLGLIVIGAIGGGAWYALNGPALHLIDTQTRADASPFFRNGVVHAETVSLYRDPDSTSPVLAVLTEGTQLVVHRTLWHDLQQWVEVEYAGKTGYVLSTQVNLS